jgi:hypothetical protein
LPPVGVLLFEEWHPVSRIMDAARRNVRILFFISTP